MAHYLVTGGCGFIGSHLVESLLAEGHRVRILDDLSTGKRENVPAQCEIVVGSITDPAQVQACMAGVDGCFHLAAIASVQQSNDAWSKTHQINLTGTINIFEAARPKKTPVVYASSAAVYGDNAEMPLKESTALRPLTAYGADKLGSELHARVAAFVHGVPVTGLRFFNVYGPRQDPSSPYSGVISIFTDRVTHGEPLTIFGDGTQVRDFVYVKDVVCFLRQAMRQACPVDQVFNVCTNRAVNINQLAQNIMAITQIRVPVHYAQARAGDIRVSIGDPSKAQQKLGLWAKTPFTEGLRHLISHLQEVTLAKVA